MNSVVTNVICSIIIGLLYSSLYKLVGYCMERYLVEVGMVLIGILIYCYMLWEK